MVAEYSEWRLSTNGGIKYKFKELTGDVSPESGTFNWTCVIRAGDLADFMNEIFPPVQQTGLIPIPVAGTMPGHAGFKAKKLSLKSLAGKPIDPFGADAQAPLGTYDGLLEATVTFGPNPTYEQPDTDPRTFLEVSSSTEMQIIFVPSEGLDAQKEENPDGSEDVIDEENAAEESGSDWRPAINVVVDQNTGKLNNPKAVGGETKAVRTPNASASIRVPITKWQLVWRRVPYAAFSNTIVHRLRYMAGRVNLRQVPVLYNALPESLLFAGFSVRESYTWRNQTGVEPSIDVTLSIMERSLIYYGVPIGWNHIWVPGIGWRRCWLSGEGGRRLPLYTWGDMNFMFRA